MRLTWEQIAIRAREFSDKWANERCERGEAQSFWNDFFAIFGVRRRQVASYERRVQSHDRLRRGFIDLFWPGTLIIEHKSGGGDLLAATGQALDYFDWLPEPEQPRYILTCDFQNWRLLDLEENREIRFALRDLPRHVEAFAFMLGRRRTWGTEARVTIDAAELMGKLHDRLAASGYTGHDLERLLVRLLFCLFADDTGIFEPKDIFLDLIENDTREDGSDTGAILMELFDILDTPEDRRQATLPDEWKAFPYVNGDLFAGRLRTPRFDSAMREALLDAARFDWSGVSPAIFGSLFQSVMNPQQRRARGAHYTTEENILKVLGPLCLDDLRAELDSAKSRKTGREAALNAFCHKLPTLSFLDPACGCGNFLVIAYRELRRLELEALEALYPKTLTGTGEEARQGFTDVAILSRVSVDQFHGIEYEEFPARIAEVAMWMTDHLANNALSLAFGTSYVRIPLRQSAHIAHADALETDWNSLLPATRCHYLLGNPPFVGAKFQTAHQRQQVRRIARLPGTGGTLDYVAAWFVQAADYMAANPRIRIGFVATNSLTQGEQVAQLWPLLFRRGLEIAFAHRTFEWSSEARGKAHVHCVILGLAHRDALLNAKKRLFSYPSIKGPPVETQHDWLSPYLVPVRAAQRHLVVKEEAKPINGAKKVVIGSKPIDGGYLILSADERADLLAREPAAAQLIRPFVGAEEYLNGSMRWIIAAQGASPALLARLPLVRARLEQVAAYRRGEIPAKGKAEATKKEPGISSSALAGTPAMWHINNLPEKPFVILPRVSSERRDYAPIGWLEPPIVPSDSAFAFLSATLYDFAILTSAMHMAWLRHIGGRLESRYRYSIGLVYNTFPWPEASPAARHKVETLAQAILDARAAPKNAAATLAQLYDPLTMPADLRAAHQALDRAVDRLYRPTPFATEAERVEHLLARYEALVNSISTAPAANRRTARRQAARTGA